MQDGEARQLIRLMDFEDPPGEQPFRNRILAKLVFMLRTRVPARKDGHEVACVWKLELWSDTASTRGDAGCRGETTSCLLKMVLLRDIVRMVAGLRD